MEATKARREAVRELLPYLEVAEIPAAVRPDGVLDLGNVLVQPPDTAAVDFVRLEAWLDRQAMLRYPSRLRSSIETELAGVPGPLEKFPGADGFSLYRSRERLVHITTTVAELETGEFIPGAFLGPGDHWDRVRHFLVTSRRALRPLASKSSDSDSAAATRRSGLPGKLSEFPSTFPSTLAQQATEASKRIRFAREVAPENAVSVEFDGGTIRYRPLRPPPYSLVLPFVFQWRNDRVDGELRLFEERDPVPCQVSGRDDRLMAFVAWAVALVCYAELTCRAPGDAGAMSTTDLWAELRRKDLVDRQIDAWVRGHLRELPLDHDHSEDAARCAARYGIRLKPGETFVRPHSRGDLPPMASGITLRCPDNTADFLQRARTLLVDRLVDDQLSG